MVIIRFANGKEWFKANWVFRQLAEDSRRMFPDDQELAATLAEAEAIGALFLESMDHSRAQRTASALCTVAKRTIDGGIIGWATTNMDDMDGQRMYVAAMQELLDACGGDEGKR